jgi:hypothetical protein
MNRATLLALVVQLVSPGVAQAQEQETLLGPAPGDHVRLRAPSVSARRLIGSVLEADAGGIRLKLEDQKEPLEVPLSAVTRLEIGRGRRSLAREGALIGAAIVVVPWGAWAVAECAGECMGEALVGVGLVAATSALLGALVGTVFKTERWERHGISRVGAAIGPRRGGAAIALSVRF